MSTGYQGRSGALRKLARASIILVAACFLAGCATTLSARVTRFEKWPANAVGATYRLVPGAGQSNNLEYQAFADTMRAAIGPTGLVEARSGALARFDVSFSYVATKGVEWMTRYADFPPYAPWGPWGYYGGGPFGPPMVNVPVAVYRNELIVIIKDRSQNDAEVYRSSAVTNTASKDLPQVMPYLARAVFDHFPGNNGQVMVVRYTLGGR
ncbi:MAG TPA: DUF4136 domain-containing protein [Burkholderiaceae bacterium]|nr:DUF4136 domain-containing protein [Burkholderiaceae bacterium]